MINNALKICVPILILLMTACEKKELIKFTDVQKEYGDTIEWGPEVYLTIPAANRLTSQQDLFVAVYHRMCIWVVNLDGSRTLNWSMKNLDNDVLLVNRQSLPKGDDLYSEITKLSSNNCSNK